MNMPVGPGRLPGVRSFPGNHQAGDSGHSGLADLAPASDESKQECPTVVIKAGVRGKAVLCGS